MVTAAIGGLVGVSAGILGLGLIGLGVGVSIAVNFMKLDAFDQCNPLTPTPTTAPTTSPVPTSTPTPSNQSSTPPCIPTGNIPGSGPTGPGSAPSPGGNGCGNVNGSQPNSSGILQISSAQQTSASGLEPGRYTIKIYPRGGKGKPLSPFTGSNDAGGYFFLPFVPQGEPFTAVALDKVTGTARTFDGVGPKTGDSIVMYFDFSDATTVTYPIKIGDTVSNGVPAQGAGTIEYPGTTDVYTFTAAAGQYVTFGLQDADASLLPFRVRLQASDGATLIDTHLNVSDAESQVLVQAGVYTLTVGDNESDGAGAYHFLLSERPAQRFAIAIGDTIAQGKPGAGAGNIETAGAYDIYTFTATAGQTVYFDELTGVDCVSPLTWRIIDSANGEVVSRQGLGTSGCGEGDAGRYTLTRGGTYAIIVAGDGAGTGTYSFKIWDVPAPQSFTIALGTTVANGVPGAGAGSIETPGVQDIYTFTVPPGQVVYFDELNPVSCVSPINWNVTDSAGNAVFGNQGLGTSGCGEGDAGVFTLVRGGVYTITVEGAGPGTGTYSFKLTPQ